MKRYKYLFIIILFWITLIEKFTYERIIIGVLVGVLVYFFNRELLREDCTTKNSSFKSFYYLLIYVVILIKEIFIANFDVAKIVLSFRMQISPHIFSYETKLKSCLNRTILANSITLTPGTFTISLEGNKLTIHCLQKRYMENVINSPLEKILLKIEEQSLWLRVSLLFH